MFACPTVDVVRPGRPCYGVRSGQLLDADRVAANRITECKKIEDTQTLLVVKRKHLPQGVKRVWSRWVDNEEKSRFVATDVAYDARDDVHAGTPALIAFITIMSLRASRRQSGGVRLRASVPLSPRTVPVL